MADASSGENKEQELEELVVDNHEHDPSYVHPGGLGSGGGAGVESNR